MSPPIVYDGLRLFLGAISPTPRGVDRVDLGYARFVFENWPGECFGLLPTPWGLRLYDRERSLRLLSSVQAAWREQDGPEAESVLPRLRAWLSEGMHQAPDDAKKNRSNLAERCVSFYSHNGLHPGRSVVRHAPFAAIYLNIGQIGWAAPVTTYWLRHRPDIAAVFMLHDVIPLQHPELVSNGGRLSQKWMLQAVLRNAAGLLTTTQSASDTVMTTLERRGLANVPLLTRPLPVSDIFLQRNGPDEDLRRIPYFVVCGAIEPRKNHQLLLRVWRRLIERIGQGAPRLVVVGSPAYQGSRIIQQFADTMELQNHVTFISGMASPVLREVMANAVGVLMPSLAEGFGLPVIEALTVGVPVLASDLPAHREAGGDLAIYLDPTDEVAWFDAVMGLVDNEMDTVELRNRIAQYRPFTAAEYFLSVSEFLTSGLR